MILLLDANVLVSDPMCVGQAWRVLAHAPESWNLRAMATEVVVAEAVGRYEVGVAESVAELRRVAKSWGRLGLAGAVEAAESTAAGAKDGYRRHLLDSLDAAGVDVIPPAEIPHMRLVERSVARRRPCDRNGDGYRDTLNWLTLLDIVESNQSEIVTWVSADTDFWNDEKTGLHEELVEDLRALDAADRVRIVRDLWGAVLGLAAEFSSDAPEMGPLRAELQEKTVITYLTSFLDTATDQLTVPSRAAGLPPETREAKVQLIEELRDMTYEVKGGVAEGEALAAFKVTATVDLTLRVPLESAASYGADEIVATGESSAVVKLRKPLLFRGVLQLGRYDRPISAELTSVEALPDDPGLAVWRLLDRRTEWGSEYIQNLGLQTDTLRKFLETSDAIKNLGPQTEAMRKMFEASDAIKNLGPQTEALRKMFESSDAIKNLGRQTEALRKMFESSDAIKNLGLQSDAIRKAFEPLLRSQRAPSGGHAASPEGDASDAQPREPEQPDEPDQPDTDDDDEGRD